MVIDGLAEVLLVAVEVHSSEAKRLHISAQGSGLGRQNRTQPKSRRPKQSQSHSQRATVNHLELAEVHASFLQ